MAVLDAIIAIQTAVSNVVGIKSAPTYPGSGQMPGVFTHLASGEITPGNPAGSRKELHSISVELHVAEGGSLSGAFQTLEGLHPLVVAALVADVTFGGKLQTYSSITYTTTRTSWDGVPTLLRNFVLNNAKVIA